MLLRTEDEILETAFQVATGTVNIQDIEFGDEIYVKIKIDDPDWKYKKTIDYKTASLMLKLQKDVLGIFNTIAEENVTLKSIKSFPDLIVNILVEEGCVEYLWEIPKKLFDYTKEMQSRHKIASLLICLAGISIGCGTWGVTSYFDLKKEELKRRNEYKAIEALEASNKALIENMTAPHYVARNLSEDGCAALGKGALRSAAEFKKDIKFNEHVKKRTVDIDDMYKVAKLDFAQQRVQLVKGELKPFWASVEWLADEQKEKLKSLAGAAIDAGTAVSVGLQVSARLNNGAISKASILRVGAKREGSVPLESVVTDTEAVPTSLQAKLPLD